MTTQKITPEELDRKENEENLRIKPGGKRQCFWILPGIPTAESSEFTTLNEENRFLH